MSEAVLDSSAVLALLLREKGADMVRDVLPGALLSMVNFAELMTKLCERGMPVDEAKSAVEMIGVEVIDFQIDQACLCSDLGRLTREAGLSLGNRACLALSLLRNLPALTADAAWGQLAGFNVVLIRGT